MKTYITRRLLLMIPVLIGISMIIFLLINMAPGDPYSRLIETNPEITAEDYQRMLDAIGYNDPIPLKYAKWVRQVLTGNLGYSIADNQPIGQMLVRRMQNTLMLALPALIISTIISVPLGVFSAVKQYSILDTILTLFALLGISIPAFYLALLLIKILAFDLGFFPIQGMMTIDANYQGLQFIMDRLYHAFLPLLVLSVLQIASRMRYTRASMLEIINQDYIRTARSKGLSERAVIYKHALRNALIPVVTVLSISLGSLLSGAVLTENVFMWPGMGRLVYTAITNRDYPVVMAGTMVLAVMMLAANLLADITYAFVDPRIRYD